MNSVMEDVIARTSNVIDQVQRIVPSGFPGWIAGTILEGIKESAQQLATELAASH